MKNIPLFQTLKLFYDFGIFFTFLNLFLFSCIARFVAAARIQTPLIKIFLPVTVLQIFLFAAGVNLCDERGIL